MKIVPRIQQNIAIKAALKGLRGSLKRALVVMATALGKTLTAAFVAKRFRAKRILFLAHNNFILDNAIEEFRLVFDKKTKMAIYNGTSKDGATEADIVFASWQTMSGNLKQWARNYFDLVIVDEAHHSEAETWKPVMKYFTGAKLGITATPDRQDEADIRNVFGPEVVNISLEEAIARGWLPRIEYHVVTDETLDENALQVIAAEIREGKKRFTMAEVNRRIFIKKRDVEIARIINGYNEKAVVFCESIHHAERLNHSLALASTFHSKKGKSQQDTWNQNRAVLNALRDGLIRRVCAVNAFNEGVNVPSIGLVAFCRVTESATIFRQQLGRGLRPGKEKLIVLDFVGNLERIQLVLEMMNRISDLHEEYTPKSEIVQEGYSRHPFEVSGKGFEFTFSDKMVDLMKILKHCERDLYPTWQEASEAARKLGITSARDYKNRYAEDDRLPSNPNATYLDFPNWKEFLDSKLYPTWQEASRAAVKLGITSREDYQNRYKEDKRLPGSPGGKYSDFPNWKEFLGKKTRKPYPTWQESSLALLKLGISSQLDYRDRYQEDDQLPSMPDRLYSNFPGWTKFLGKQTKKPYPSWQEASRAAIKLGITSDRDYRERYKGNDRLPSTPGKKYPDFPGWATFLNKQ
jgi:superfamily II DNA or RNA helicase